MVDNLTSREGMYYGEAAEVGDVPTHRPRDLYKGALVVIVRVSTSHIALLHPGRHCRRLVPARPANEDSGPGEQHGGEPH